MSESNTQGSTQANGGADSSDFDANWNAFMNSSFGTDEDGEFTQPGGEGEDSTSGEDTTSNTVQGGQGADSVSGETGTDTITASTSGQDSAAAPASSTVSGGGAADAIDPVVDQQLVAAVLGLGDAGTTTATSAPAAQGEGQPPKESPSGQQTDDGPYMPFKPEFKLQPQLVSALFESEDAETRHQALVQLLSAFGNTVTATIDQRWRDHYQPRTIESFAARQEEQNAARAVNQDFYSNFPELAGYKPAVTRAFRIIAESEPFKGKPYSVEVRNAVGNLAKRALTQAGIQFAQKKEEAKPAPQGDGKPKPAPKGNTPFEAGAGRPAATTGDNGPADLVQQLSEF